MNNKDTASQSQAVPSELASDWPTHADLLAEDLEKIAESWTGCMYDAPGETIDIGADLRAAFAKLNLADLSLSHSEATGKVPGDERAAFEAWVDSAHLTKYAQTGKPEAGYYFPNTQTAWEGWSARAALASPAAPLAGKAEPEGLAKLCDQLLDIWDDGRSNAPEHRTYREGALDEVIEEIREYFVHPLAAAVPAEEASEKHLPGWERGIATVTMNGHQLREALDFINPDGAGDPDQLDDDLTFGIVQHKDDEGKVTTGLCCWNDDTDGVLPLDGAPAEPASIQASAERELDLYDEIECDLQAMFGRAAQGGHEEGQRIAKMLREKMQRARAEAARLSKPTAQGAAQSIDTPEFRELLAQLLDDAEKADKANDPMLYKPARDRFVNFIDRHIAAQAPAGRDAMVPVLHTIRRLLDDAQPKDIPGALMVIDSSLNGRAWSYEVAPPSGFVSYVKANYSGEVEFHDPAWHATRLWNAAMRNVSSKPPAPHAAEQTEGRVK